MYYTSKFPPLVKDKEERGLHWYRNENVIALPALESLGSPLPGVLFPSSLLLLPGHRDAYPTCEVVEVQLCYDVAKLIYLCKER